MDNWKPLQVFKQGHDNLTKIWALEILILKAASKICGQERHLA